MAARPGRRASSAFTLLELLLAVTILAAITAFVAGLWASARDWTSDNASHHRALRLSQVLEIARAQWGDRRTSIQVDTQGSRAIARPDALIFVTATPILFPEAPLVQAMYAIEPSGALPGAGRANLVYQETRILRFDQPPPDAQMPVPTDLSVPSDRVRRRSVLLESVEGLRFERFGMPDVSAAAGPPPPADSRPTGGARSPQRRDWFPFTSPAPASSTGAAPVPAVRLVGRFQNQEFACVFVIEASR
ncbi:MAG: type II secretion system protein [Phycisphaerales bacterium]|nr:type II secretion system protein [Phycisphaerales bacterium]